MMDFVLAHGLQHHWRAGIVSAVVLLLVSRSPLTQPTQAARASAVPAAAPSVDEQLERGFDLAYNLDYDEAVDVLKKAATQDPSNSGVQRALAVATWLHLLFTRGTVLVDDYLGAVSKRDVSVKPPP